MDVAGALAADETVTAVPAAFTVASPEDAANDTADESVQARLTGWLFPSAKSRSGHIEDVPKCCAAITETAGTKFWFHGLRNSFITVAERELLLPRSLTKRLVNHSRGSDVTEGYAADWTVEQLREPVQRIADRIEELMEPI